MTHSANPGIFHVITTMMKSALTIFMSVLCIGVPTAGLAQAPVSLQQDVMLYHAFYYSASNTLLHIEAVQNAAGRSIKPLSRDFVPQPAPPNPPLESGAAVLIGDQAAYVIYFGLDMSTPPKDGSIDVTVLPLAMERLLNADKDRAIKCASMGPHICVYPKVCHKPCATGGCCCY